MFFSSFKNCFEIEHWFGHHKNELDKFHQEKDIKTFNKIIKSLTFYSLKSKKFHLYSHTIKKDYENHLKKKAPLIGSDQHFAHQVFQIFNVQICKRFLKKNKLYDIFIVKILYQIFCKTIWQYCKKIFIIVKILYKIFCKSSLKHTILKEIAYLF